jgi:UDP-N-acetylmuramate dehydrogenase
MKNYFIRELGDEVKFNVPLKDFVSLKVGGAAEMFYEAKDIESLTKAIVAADKKSIPFFVLGGGYNIVPSDAGVAGLVIKNSSSNIILTPESSVVIADSGVSLGRLINLAAGRDLGGLEFLAGIPSTVGGAIYGNAGSPSSTIGEYVKSVTMLVKKDDKLVIEKHDKEWMQFGYRTSRLKKNKSKDAFTPVILTATLQLIRRRKDEIMQSMKETIHMKKKNQPLDESSAGSFFRNPGIGKEMAAGYLLEKSGAKKMKIGGATFSRKHANFLVNKKRASADDIRLLAEKAKLAVADKCGVNLEEEVEYIGQW